VTLFDIAKAIGDVIYKNSLEIMEDIYHQRFTPFGPGGGGGDGYDQQAPGGREPPEESQRRF